MHTRSPVTGSTIRHGTLSGFTFLEILAVILIISMISGVLIGVFRIQKTQTSFAQTFYHFDQDVRYAARFVGPITMHQRGLRLYAIGNDFRKELKLDVGVRFKNKENKTLQAWTYDQYGCTIDFQLVYPGGHNVFHGLSGVMQNQFAKSK